MGAIQSDISSMVGTLGVLAGLSGVPQARAAKKAEAEREAKEQQRLDKQAEVTSRAVDEASKHKDIDNPMIAENDAYIEALKNAESARKAQFERNPSDDTYAGYQEAFTRRQMASADLDDARERWKKETDDLIKKQEEAMADMERKKGAKTAQKRNFMEYLRKQPIALGDTSSGTIGDLPKEAQKQIASQYTRSQRKTMMDRMDKEAMKSGK